MQLLLLLNFQKDQSQAINVLQKSIDVYFPEMSAEFQKVLRWGSTSATTTAGSGRGAAVPPTFNRTLFQDFSRRKPFVEAS